MNRKTLLWAGAVLLFLCAYAIVAGHDLLARLLATCSLRDDFVAPERMATVAGSLIVHGCTGVFILPIALQSRRCGVPVEAVRICIWTALFAVIGRGAAEATTGVLVASYPALAVAVVTVVMSMVLAPRSWRRAWGVRGVVSGGSPMLQRHGNAGRTSRSA